MKRPDPKAAALSLARGVGASLQKPASSWVGDPEVRTVANRLLDVAHEVGVGGEVKHSGSSAGNSSYVMIGGGGSVPENFTIRVSDHSVGPFRFHADGHVHVRPQDADSVARAEAHIRSFPDRVNQKRQERLDRVQRIRGQLGLGDDPAENARLLNRRYSLEGVPVHKSREEAELERDSSLRPLRPLLKRAAGGSNSPLPAVDYRGSHQPISAEFGAPAHDLTKVYPDDVYGPMGARYYGHGGDDVGMDHDTMRKLHRVRDKPRQAIQIYRAVPRDESIKSINPGDWVTINRDYAKNHGESTLQGNYKILNKIVDAREIFTSGDSIHEWGYHPVDRSGSSSGDDITKAEGGSVDHLKKLAEAADQQRGGPEIAMTQAQRALGGGLLSHCLEHVGDLYNRMHNTGYGALDEHGPTEERRHVVLDKIAKTLRPLTQKYGFEKEHNENMEANASYRLENEGVSPEDYRAGVDAALSKYAEEHAKLPVYNLPQRLARDASIALGEKDFGKATSSLFALRDLAQDPDRWHQEINKFDQASVPKASGGSVEDTLLDSTGKPVHHTPEGVEAFKKWHEGSKVVDEQGRPLVLYHGMTGPMEGDSFRASTFGTLGEGIYFTPHPDAASKFATGVRGSETEPKTQGQVLPVYLQIKQPFDDDFFVGNKPWQEWAASVLRGGYDDSIWKHYSRWVLEAPYEKEGYLKLHDKLMNRQATLNDLLFTGHGGESRFGGEILRHIKNHGDFDGVILKNSPKGFGEYLVFNPGQIKSAVANDGTYDHPTDITKAAGGEIDAPPPADIDAAKEQFLTDTAGINRRPLEGHDPRMLFHTSAEEQSDDGGYGPEDPAESTEQYRAFDPDRSELGIHVGSRDQAEGRIDRYALETGSAPRTLPLYVSIKNPIRLQDFGNFHWHAILPQLERQNVMSFQDAEKFLKDMHEVMEEHGALSDETDKIGNAYMREFLKGKGYDSAVYLNRVEGVLERPPAPGKGTSIVVPIEHIQPAFTDEMFRRKYPGAHDSYIIFDPPQAKSIFATEYNRQKGDLSKAEGGEIEGAPEEGMELHALNPEHAEEYIRAYHGTPHSFDEFDASKIGTGEGAQAYGHGIYVAESPDVAKSYAVNLSNRDMRNQGRLNAHANAKRLAAIAGDPNYAADDIRFALENEPDHPQKKLLQDTLSFLESGEHEKPLESSGNLYKVDVPKDMVESMLDWEKPLIEQPPAVRQAINSIVEAEELYKGKYAARFLSKHTTGSDAVEALNDALGGPSVTSNYLRDAGIPGIRYFDADSRGSKSGTRNFVVFPGEEHRLKIRKAGGGSATDRRSTFKLGGYVVDVSRALRVARKARGMK